MNVRGKSQVRYRDLKTGRFIKKTESGAYNEMNEHTLFCGKIGRRGL